MFARLNPPERILYNLATASERMRRIDEIVGEARITRFARELSRLLAHQESEESTLCSAIQSVDIQAQLSLNLINSSAELETGWNVLRLANVPSAQRHGRVASEFIGMAVLNAIPRDILGGLGREVPIARLIQMYPDRSIADLCQPQLSEVNGAIEVREPLLLSTHAFSSFLVAAERILQLPAEQTENLRRYRRQVQHPASHGSWLVTSYHFEDFSGGAAGAVFDPKREGTYIAAAEDLISLADIFATILDASTGFLQRQASGG